MGTKEKITRKALELFNHKGIEYVGMRELAAALSMQIGNITYYFPTKDELVNQLALDLSALNAKTLRPAGDLTLVAFLEMQEMIFTNQYRYRCLFLSFVHLVRQNPFIAERYKHIDKARGENFTSYVKSLQAGKYLASDSGKDTPLLVDALGLVSRFWISETAISNSQLTAEKQIRHYSGMIARMLIPYATRKGRNQIDNFLHR
jgi:AcrR family transcriptional regulator